MPLVVTQKEALTLLKLGRNVYLTGQAGSGKTYLLNEYIQFLRSQQVNVGVTASTGIAATHVGGMTIHSWSGMGIRDALTPQDMQKWVRQRHIKRRFLDTKVLVIDEVSMLHAHQLDLVDLLARTIRENDEPFGGMQVVLCGDFFQLPPVSRSRELPVRFVTESKAWQELDMNICYLTEQYRQSDGLHTRVLHAIRSNRVDESVLALLRQRYRASILGVSELTRLYTHNFDVDAVNRRQLEEIKKPGKRYVMESDGPAPLVEALKKGCLAPEELVLKEGALVMFVKNHFEDGYVNGTLGRVVEFTREGEPIVRTLQGEEVLASPASWTLEEDGVVQATITQIPLRLAWAITVHKSQGMSLDAAEMDLSRAFEPGMGYVALSRVRTLDGLRLLGLNDMALRVSDAVLAMDEELQRRSRQAVREIEALLESERLRGEQAFLQRVGAQGEKEQLEQEKRKSNEMKAYAVDDIRETQPQAYRRWTEVEEEELIAAFERGASIVELAQRHGRQPGGIRSRLRKLAERGKVKYPRARPSRNMTG